MRNPRMTRKPAVGLSVAAIAIALCCAAWAADLAAEPKPAAVDAERYADFMAHEARDVRDLAAGAELQRRTFDRITPAGVAWFQPMQPAVVPFAAANFDAAFLEDLLGEERNSVAVYPLVLALDPQTRATLVRNVEGKLLATVPASKDFRWGPADADPARVTLQVDLLPAEDVEPYLYAEDRIAQSLAVAAANTRKPPRAGTVAARSLFAGDFGFAGVQHPTNGNFWLTVTNGTDAAEIYSCTVWHTSAVVVVTWTNEASNVVTDTNVVWTPVSPAFAGIESAWELAATNLTLTNGVGAWEDANVSSNARIRFYAAAKRVDSDGDGLNDGAETFLHRTDPGVADTDGDGMPDGWEVRNGLNARSGLADTLIGWWKLDDGEGTAAVNSAQDAYHGELVGFSGTDGGWTTEGRLGGALRFDGLDDWVRIAQEAMLPTGGAFTISAWVKLDGTCTSDWPEAVGDMVDATWNGYCLGGDADHAAFAMVGPTAWIQDTNSMADEWTWLALEFDGANMRLYRDGAALGDPVPATFVPATNGYVAIGNGPDAGTSERWKGLIDDVRIYGAALGTNDLADLYAALEDPDGDGLSNREECELGTDIRESNEVVIVYFVDGTNSSAGGQRSMGGGETTHFVTWNALQAKAASTVRFKEGYAEFTNSTLPPSDPPKWYLSQEQDTSGTIVDQTLSWKGYILSNASWRLIEYDPAGWPSAPTNHKCTGNENEYMYTYGNSYTQIVEHNYAYDQPNTNYQYVTTETLIQYSGTTITYTTNSFDTLRFPHFLDHLP